MTTKASLSDAYDVVTEFHKSILDKLAAEQDRSQAAYAAIMANFPDNAKAGQVYQCAQQLSQQMTYNYQLNVLRQQYGLVSSNATTPVTNA